MEVIVTKNKDSAGHLIGQKLMFAFEGTTVPAEILDDITEKQIAGVTIFRAFNVDSLAQIRTLTATLQTAAKNAGNPPLLIAADQEGGQLNALGEETTQFAGNMALGATDDPELARRVGFAMGRELAALGINVSYAPDCDISTNPKNPACGTRSFGDNPNCVASLATAYTVGMQTVGVAATVKHFPGCGDAQEDSHYHMPLIAHNRERLDAVELLPFRATIDADAKVVMSGHFAVPALTKSTEIPATLSRSVMHDFVRDELGFNGVVITDAFDMSAITQGTGQIIDAIAAFRAQVDLLLLTSDRDVMQRLYEGMQLALGRGLLSEEEIQKSVQRIRHLRQWVGRAEQPPLSIIQSTEHVALAQEVAERAITLVRNQAGLLPLSLNADARLLVIMPQPKDLTPADTSSYVKPRLAEMVRTYHPDVDETITSHPPTDDEIAALGKKASEYDLVILGTIDAHMDAQQAQLANLLLSGNVPLITVALRTPYDLTAYPQAKTYLCTYSILPSSMRALATLLFGHLTPSGKLPVDISNLHKRGHGLNSF